MNISFDNGTFGKLGYLADIEGISIAAYISKLCDEHVKDLVQANYSLRPVSSAVTVEIKPTSAQVVADTLAKHYGTVSARDGYAD